MPMQPSPWRDTLSPWLPSSIISMSWAPLHSVWPPRRGGGTRAHPTGRCLQRTRATACGSRAVSQGVGRDLGRAHEHGAAAFRRHDPVEFGPVVVGTPGRPEDGPDDLGHIESEVRPVLGSDEPHRTGHRDPFETALEDQAGRPGVAEQAQLAAGAGHDRTDARLPVDRIVDDAGAHDRGVHRPVEPRCVEDGQVVIGGGQPVDELQVCHKGSPSKRLTKPFYL